MIGERKKEREQSQSGHEGAFLLEMAQQFSLDQYSMWWKVVLFVLVSVLKETYSYQCFIDTYGTYPAKDGEVLDTGQFKVFNCSMNTRIQKVSILYVFLFVLHASFEKAIRKVNVLFAKNSKTFSLIIRS